MKKFIIPIMVVMLSAAAVASAQTDEYDLAAVTSVKAIQSNSSWRFDVSVRHNDQGWEHYADAWQIIDPETLEILGERVLLHPHDKEQPFTRSLSNVIIDPAQSMVLLQAKCNVHGFGGESMIVYLTDTDKNSPEVIVRRQ